MDAASLSEAKGAIVKRIKGIPVVTVINVTLDGFTGFSDCIKKGKTYCMLGSSGAGKSSLINNPGMREVGITEVADGLDMTFMPSWNTQKPASLKIARIRMKTDVPLFKPSRMV